MGKQNSTTTALAKDVKPKKKVPGRPFKKGQSGNPKGRPLGSRDRRTVIMDAIIRIGEKKKMTPEEIEEAIQVSGIEKALKGSFLHYAEISNGLYGKVAQKTDITSGGEKIVTNAIIFADLNEANSK
jgi:hypothetical protein